MVGEKLGITDQFTGVDFLEIQADGSLKIKERVEGGQYQVSVCSAPPAVLAWATGSLPEPPNNPQVGMMNMKKIMPALQKARSVTVKTDAIVYEKVEIPLQKRETRIVKDTPAEEIAREIVDWIKE
jgi:electron transfer flavoprotein beta subunit